MVALGYVPKYGDDMLAYYGNPDANNDEEVDKHWLETQTSVFKLPYPMVASWRDSLVFTHLRMHNLVDPAMLDALYSVLPRVGLQELQDRGWDRTGGVFCFRPAKGDPTKLSTHSFAAAIDVNPHLGPFGRKSKQPKVFIEAFVWRGFVYGGRWKKPWTDGMHMQGVM